MDERGTLLGEFRPEDQLLIISKSGVVKTSTPELSLHFSDDMLVLEKWVPKTTICIFHWEGEKERYYVRSAFSQNRTKRKTYLQSTQNRNFTVFLPTGNQ